MLAHNIRKARRALGLTQRQLAKNIGVIHATVSNYETGRVIPDAVRLQQIAQELGVDTNQLMTKLEAQKRPAAKEPDDKDLTTLVTTIASQQQTIARLVELIAK